MQLYPGADASTPVGPAPDGTKIVCGYVGQPDRAGAPDTPHIWTPDEWNQFFTADPTVRFLPVYTHDFPGDPLLDAEDACNAVIALGWTEHAGRLIVWDAETLVDPEYAAGVAERMAQRGFAMFPYGSESFVTRNPTHAGYFISSPRPRAPRALPFAVHGWQWQFGAQWDLSVFDQFVYDNCGRGARRAG